MKKLATRLRGLPAKDLERGHTLLEQAGVSPAHWLAFLAGGSDAAAKIAAAFPLPSIVYSSQFVGKTLGIKTPNIAAPDPIPGRCIIWVPQLIAKDLANLRRSNASKVMWDQTWYDGQYTFDRGDCYHVVEVPLEGSNNQSNAAQETFVPKARPGFLRTHIIVDSLLWCVHKMSTGEDIFKGNVIRTPQEGLGGNRAALYENDGRLYVGVSWSWYDGADPGVFGSASRELPTNLAA